MLTPQRAVTALRYTGGRGPFTSCYDNDDDDDDAHCSLHQMNRHSELIYVDGMIIQMIHEQMMDVPEPEQLSHTILFINVTGTILGSTLGPRT